MRITREEALGILGVEAGASLEDIRTSYKRLALKWHPDKQDGTIGKDEATRKFQEVSAAYKKLTTRPDSDIEGDDDGMTLGEMMELFAQLFSFRNGIRHCNCHNHHHYYNYDEFSDDEDYDDYTDDDSDDEFWESIASRLRNKWEARKFMQKDTTDYNGSRITEEEALKNAQELIEEEEIEKKRKEKKKAKKKKKKEKKKQKDSKAKEEKENDKKEELKEEATAVKKEKEKEEKPQIDKIQKSNLMNGFIHTEKHDKSDKHDKSKNNNTGKTNVPTTEETIKSNKKKVIQEDIGPIPTNNKNDHRGQQKRHTTNIKTSSDEDDAIDTNSAFFARVASKAPTTTNTQNTRIPYNHSTSKENIDNKKKEKTKTEPVSEKKENTKTANKSAPKKLESKSSNKKESKPPDTKQAKSQNQNISSSTHLNDNLDAVVLKSRQVAVKGNELASKGDYHGAIKMFAQAIQLDPTDFRFFGNRSYCHDRVGQYNMALEDSEAAIRLAPEWAKGYFRKGRALTGLERYQEAEAAFQQVLKLDAHCEDAQFELARVRVQILTNMGFERGLAEEAVRTFGTVQSSLEALLAGKVTVKEIGDEVYNSDGDENIKCQTSVSSKNWSVSSVSNNKKTIITPTASQSKQKLSCGALWVGNVDPQHLNEKSLSQLFGKVGKVVNVKILPEKYCAFINYANPEDTAKALEKLQGYEVGGQNLLIRYPNNPPPGSSAPSGGHSQSPPQQKIQNTAATLAESASAAANRKSLIDKNLASKLSGPVNGDECYFWRTTGCAFNNQCRYKHVSSHKGVDLQKVRAKYGNHL